MTKPMTTTVDRSALAAPIRGSRSLRGWLVSAAATVTTSYGINLAATGFGLLLVALVSGVRLAHGVVVAARVASYLVWWPGSFSSGYTLSATRAPLAVR